MLNFVLLTLKKFIVVFDVIYKFKIKNSKN